MEAQTQKNSITNRWQTIGVCTGMIIGFVYPSIGLALGMLMGIVFGKLSLVEIPLNTPLAQRAQQKSEIIFLLILFILFIEHWYVPCKQAIANLIN